VCCLTHDYRDQLGLREAQVSGDPALAAFMALFTSDEGFRCQCSLTANACQRRATEEDRRCDWCRSTDHMKWCEANPGSSGMAGRPRGEYASSERDRVAGYSPRGVLYDEVPNYAEFVREMNDGAVGAELCDPNGQPYGGGFYQAGVVPGFGFRPPPFEFPAEGYRQGLAGMSVVVNGSSLTPSEIKSMLGLPPL
jgi:hypothetical protein